MSDTADRPPLALRQSTLLAVGEALSQNGVHPPGPGSEVHQAIRALASEAREAGIPVEQVIIQIKRQWSESARPSRNARRSDSAQVLERLVTLCLDEYFKGQ